MPATPSGSPKDAALGTFISLLLAFFSVLLGWLQGYVITSFWPDMFVGVAIYILVIGVLWREAPLKNGLKAGAIALATVVFGGIFYNHSEQYVADVNALTIGAATALQPAFPNSMKKMGTYNWKPGSSYMDVTFQSAETLDTIDLTLSIDADIAEDGVKSEISSHVQVSNSGDASGDGSIVYNSQTMPDEKVVHLPAPLVEDNVLKLVSKSRTVHVINQFRKIPIQVFLFVDPPSDLHGLPTTLHVSGTYVVSHGGSPHEYVVDKDIKVIDLRHS